MKTVGALLRETRQVRGLSLEDVEKATKIQPKFLAAIENDEFHKLPSLAYAKGFVRNYAEYLEISTDLAMAFFRRQTKDTLKSAILPRGVASPINASWFQLTPGRFLALLIGGLTILFLAYLGVQYQRIKQPPMLSIDSPKHQAVVSEKRIALEGRTDPDATVMVNGVAVIVRQDGRFYDQVPLESGINKITVVATSRFGKTTTVMREVGYQP